MGKSNFDDVLDRLDEFGIVLTGRSLDKISLYFSDNDYSSHYRDFELFEKVEGVYLVSIAGQWLTTKKVLH